MKDKQIFKTFFKAKANLVASPVEIETGEEPFDFDYEYITEQPDLLNVESVMVSVGINANDDVFLSQELIKARNTGRHKPQNMEHKESESTLEFIQLVRCIIEYYGTTKSNQDKKDNKSIENTLMDDSLESQLNEAEKLLSSVDGFDLGSMSIDIPKEVDDAVKKTFLSQLKKFEEFSKYINS